MEKYFKDRNFLTAIVFLVFDAVYLFFGLQIPVVDSSSCGAGFMPRVYGFCMLAVALILLVTTIAKIQKENPEETKKKEADMTFQKEDMARIGGAFLTILLFAALLRDLGFIICSIPLLFVLVVLLSPAHVKEAYIKKQCCDGSGNMKKECLNAKGKVKFNCMVPYYGKILLFSIVFTIFIYVLFGQALGLKMPAGILKNVLPF